jgi:hypothetical protein
MPVNLESTSSAAGPTNGASTLHDLFAMTDEQILEIEPEAQDVQVRCSTDAADVSLNTQADSLPRAAGDASRKDASRAADASQHQPQSTSHQSPVTSHQSSEPPPWLAERMTDPQSGADARELWNGVQQTQQEAASYREIFAKPEDARAAAGRARLLYEIDRAYFTGDATQRAQLAASMLREDPAAFREMVFAGLRALEETGQRAGERSATQSSAEARTAAPLPGNTSASDAQLAAYATFERAANNDLERSVGGAIERTLDHALPNGGRAETAGMKGRLAATIRQDIEKALQGDRQLGEQVAQVLSSRRLDNEARAQVVRLIGERAQQLVPSAAKRVLNDWTQTTLASHRGRQERSESAATKREVEPASAQGRASGSSPASSPRSQQSERRQHDAGTTNAARRVDYRKLSDDQILDL